MIPNPGGLPLTCCPIRPPLTGLKAPLAGESFGEFLQPTSGLGESGLLRTEVVRQREGLGDPGTGRLTVAGLVPAAHHDARQAPVAGAVGDAGHHLAAQRLVVERAL